ncbi:hypothetical protein [Nocardioides marinquilinus]
MRASMRACLLHGLAVLVATGSLAAVAPAAHAETWHVTDRWHDVQSMDTSGDGPMSTTPRNRSADITALQVHHGTRWVTATLRVRDLTPRDRVVVVSLALPDRVEGYLAAWLVDGEIEAESSLLDGMDFIDCPATASTQPRRGVVRLAVRRDCLGDPEWVRANGSVSAGSERSFDDSRRAFTDVVLGPVRTRTGRVAYGPRIEVG